MSLSDFLRRLFVGHRDFSPGRLPDAGLAPEITGLTGWVNAAPLQLHDLRGQVVLLDFWTHSCINCQRTLPYLNAWHAAYGPLGLRIIGIHTPEFSFEKGATTVQAAIDRAQIKYPVALDDAYAVWNGYRNKYWPAHYFVDATGHIRHHQFGEGGYNQAESVIRSLLSAMGHVPDFPPVNDTVKSSVDFQQIRTPETYLGFDRMENLGSPQPIRGGQTIRFTGVAKPARNVFYFEGLWRVEDEWSGPASSESELVFRFEASQLYMVAESSERPVSVTVTVDGADDIEHGGADAAVIDGRLTMNIAVGRLHHVLDFGQTYRERTVRLHFHEAGARLYAFTFG